MNRTMSLLLSLALAVGLASTVLPTGVAGNDREAEDEDLAVLLEWMTGSFGSQAQAAADSEFFDIRLEMVRIWAEHPDGYWLYVEQAAATALDRPYRQRVYHLHRQDDDLVASDVYRLPGQQRFVGAWRNPAVFSFISPDSLQLREGCTIYLRRKDAGPFTGRTDESDCGSSLHGASYATSEVTITAEELISWDRGFDADGNQVWGATKGGYVFEKARPATAEDAAAAVLAADRAFARHSIDEGIPEAFERYATEEATLFRDNSHPTTGREAIRDLFAGAGGAHLHWEPYFADVAESGDLAYTLGRYEYRAADDDGVARGYYVTIWRRQKDGSWKYVFDSGVTAPADEPEPGE